MRASTTELVHERPQWLTVLGEPVVLLIVRHQQERCRGARRMVEELGPQQIVTSLQEWRVLVRDVSPAGGYLVRGAPRSEILYPLPHQEGIRILRGTRIQEGVDPTQDRIVIPGHDRGVGSHECVKGGAEPLQGLVEKTGHLVA